MSATHPKKSHTVYVIGTNGQRLSDEDVEVDFCPEGNIPLQLTRGNRIHRFSGKRATRRSSGHNAFELADVAGRERLWIDEYLAMIFED